MRALIIEDHDSDANLVNRELRRGGRDVDVEIVATAAATRPALTARSWDLILDDCEDPCVVVWRACSKTRHADFTGKTRQFV